MFHLTRPLREDGTRFRKGLLTELALWRSFWNVDSRFVMLNFDSINAPSIRERSTCLASGFHLHFAPKMGSGATNIWGFRFHLRVLDWNGGMC